MSTTIFLIRPETYPTAGFTNAKSLLTDGVDEGCTLSTQLYNGQTNYSWSYWVKFTGAINTQNSGVDWARSGAKYNGFTLAGNQLRFYIQGSTNGIGILTASSNISSGTWYNFIWTYDGGGVTNADKLKLYLDGVQKTLSFSGTIPTSLTTNSLTSHAIPNNASLAGILPMLGNVDEIAHWSGTTLSSGDVTDIYNGGTPNDLTSLSPSHWWRYGDGSGDDQNTIYDQVGAVNLTGVNLEAGDIVTDTP